MQSDEYILAIDHGTSGIKAALVTTTGRVVDFEFAACDTEFISSTAVEQDPAGWWRATIDASKRLVRKGIVETDRISAVCVSSTFSTTVAVDREGQPLMNAITWMDSRGAPYVQQLMSGFPSISGYGIKNLLKWIPRSGGGPTLSGKDDIAHILLIKNEFPQVYEKTYRFLPSKDYLNLKFTGEFAASFDSIHLFWMTDIRDINNIRYDQTLIDAAGIDGDKLPPLKRSIALLGAITAEVAEEIGLNRNVKVFVGSPDHQCAGIGAGAVRDYEAHLYIGTSSWIQCTVPFKKLDIAHSIASFPMAIPGKYYTANEQDIAGGVLDFLLDQIIYYKGRLLSAPRPENPYQALDEIAGSVAAGSNKLIFTPWLNGERTPVDDAALRGCLFNISLQTNQDHIIRAILEGVAYNTRWSFGYVEKFIGRKMLSLNMVGGGARSDVWCQIFADVLDREIRRVKDPRQANARGAAFIASVGLGRIAFDDIPNLIEIERTFHPNPENRVIYDELFAEFVQIYKSNRRIFHRLNEL